MTIHIKTCAACGKVIGINQRRCASCDASRVGWVSPRQKQYDKKRDPEEVKFRRSRQWRMTRDYIIQRDGYLCQECRKHGIGDNGTRDVIGLHLYTSPRR